MRHRVAGRKLSRPTGHRASLYRNLVTDLLRYERISTTEAKAKQIRGIAEKVITLGKEGSLHSRRQASAIVSDKKVKVVDSDKKVKVLDKVFNELAPRYAQRNGGYTRILKLGRRAGDGAPVAQIELVK